MSRLDALFDLLRGEVSVEDPAEAAPLRMPFDLRRVDAEAFLADIDALREELEAELGEDDIAHLRRIERIGRAATLVGVATAWLGPNPLSIVGLSLGRSTRWLLMHHCGHRGYDKVPGVPARYTSRVFARGRRRFVDWPDWMIPEAWNYEHNVLHHGHTGELRDPDLIERNTETLRALGLPLPLRYVAMAGLALTWRSLYYAPQTLAALRELRAKRGRDADGPGFARELWSRCYAPYAALQFALLPALFAPLGPFAVASALVNSLGAEALTNLHTFLVVGPNHTGDDLYRFDDKPASRAEAVVRQVIASVNYAIGGDGVDYAHLWLNYQIEHHLYPDLPMLAYRKAAPRVRAICAKHGVPYVQESVFSRAKKMLDVAVGRTSMRRGVVRMPAERKTPRVPLEMRAG